MVKEERTRKLVSDSFYIFADQSVFLALAANKVQKLDPEDVTDGISKSEYLRRFIEWGKTAGIFAQFDQYLRNLAKENATPDAKQ